MDKKIKELRENIKDLCSKIGKITGKQELKNYRFKLLRLLEKDLFGPYVSPKRIKKNGLELTFFDHLFGISYKGDLIRVHPEELYDILQKEKKLRKAFVDGDLKKIYNILKNYRNELEIENR